MRRSRRRRKTRATRYPRSARVRPANAEGRAGTGSSAFTEPANRESTSGDFSEKPPEPFHRRAPRLRRPRVQHEPFAFGKGDDTRRRHAPMREDAPHLACAAQIDRLAPRAPRPRRITRPTHPWCRPPSGCPRRANPCGYARRARRGTRAAAAFPWRPAQDQRAHRCSRAIDRSRRRTTWGRRSTSPVSLKRQ